MERKTISRETAKLQLEHLRRAQVQAEQRVEPTQTDLAYWKAAAVLSSYQPGRLMPLDLPAPEPGEAYAHVLSASEPVPSQGRDLRWRLRSAIRQLALKELGNRANMLRALAANPERPSDAVQKALEALIHEENVDYSRLDAGSIAGYLSAADWLRPVLDDVPSKQMLLRNSARAKLLQPLHKLVGDHFVGRERALRRLRGYVGVLPSKGILESIGRAGADLYYSLADRPPFFIYGPGGIGKSTLIAKFLIDHVEFDSEHQMPFIYLNFDRPALAADQPLTLLADAVYQIAVQFPE